MSGRGLTLAQDFALGCLQRAREDDPTTSDGLMYGGETFYDREIKVAIVNHQTAKALRHRGYITFGEWDPDWGTELKLVEASA